MTNQLMPKGEAPQGWVCTRLGDIVAFEYGKGLRKDRRDIGGRVPVYGSNGILGYHSDSLVRGPCIVIGRKGAIGQVHLSKSPCWPIDTTYYVCPPDCVSLAFSYLLLSYLRLGSLDRSTAIPGLNRDDAYRLAILVPPLPEQHRIVAKIEELFTRLDAGVEALTKIKAQLKRYRQAVLKHAYEGKLTAEWRKAHQHELEPASVLLERIKQERQKNTKGRRKELAPLDTSGLTQLPAGWEWTVAGEITSVVSGGTPDTRDKLNFGGDVVWLTPADLSGWCQKHISRGARNITDRGLRSSSAVLLPKGAIVFSSRAPIGYVAIAATELCTNQGFKSFIPSDGVYNEYLYYYLKASTSLARSMASGTTFLELSASRAVGLPVPLPAISEQYRIVDEIERRFSVVEQIEKTVDQGLKQAERLRQSILKKAFEGKLVAQDPDDEPAEILLERIREERAKQLAQKRITVSRVKRKQSVEGH